MASQQNGLKTINIWLCYYSDIDCCCIYPSRPLLVRNCLFLNILERKWSVEKPDQSCEHHCQESDYFCQTITQVLSGAAHQVHKRFMSAQCIGGWGPCHDLIAAGLACVWGGNSNSGLCLCFIYDSSKCLNICVSTRASQRSLLSKNKSWSPTKVIFFKVKDSNDYQSIDLSVRYKLTCKRSDESKMAVHC